LDCLFSAELTVKPASPQQAPRDGFFANAPDPPAWRARIRAQQPGICRDRTLDAANPDGNQQDRQNLATTMRIEGLS
jgi:hypothetical protein